MEVVGLVAFLHAPVDFGCLAYGVAVERQEFVQGKEIFRLYAVNTAKDVAAGIADAAVRVNETVDDILGNTDVLAVVSTRYPEPDKVGTVFVNEFLGGDAVAEGLGHLHTLAVDHVAVGED